MQQDLKLFNDIVQQLLEAEDKQPVASRITTSELYSKLDLALPDAAPPAEKFETALRDLVLSSPRTSTRLFFNQLFGGRNSKAVLGDLLAVLLNISLHTYKVAGAQIGIEKILVRKVAQLVGYPENADGTMAAGGSMTNFMGMLMARDAYDENIRQTGMQGPLVCYTSQESHYSVTKNAAFAGIGRKNVRFVKTNDKGEMLAADLEVQIQADLAAGKAPFFVNATAGTTVLGAFDPLDELSVVCQKYKLWLHVDGAYGGSALFSKKYQHLIKGAHLVDSFSVNGHKMLGTPLSCSIIVTRHPRCLHDSFSNEASYLYQTDGDDYNVGKISLQCGRRNDALKLWTLWKAVGTEGLEKIVDHLFHLADFARNYVRNHADYQLYSYDGTISICFNYKGWDAQELCTKLYEENEIMVGYGKFREEQFVRLIMVNAGNTEEDILNFFRKMEECLD